MLWHCRFWRSHWAIRRGIAEIVALLKTGDAIPALIGTLRNRKGTLVTVQTPSIAGTLEYRLAAIEALRVMKASEAIPVLIEAMKEINCKPALLKAATEALGAMKASEAIPVLIDEALLERDSGVAKAAAKALGTMKASMAIPALMVQLENSDAKVRKAALKALYQIDPDCLYTPHSGERIILLTELLTKSYDKEIRRGAIKALVRIGNDWTNPNNAANVIPALIESLADTDEAVREAASEALSQIDPNWRESIYAPEGISTLMNRLAVNYNSVQREKIINALGVTKAKEALPVLVELTTEKR